MVTQNIYEYKKVKLMDYYKVSKPTDPFECAVVLPLDDDEKFKRIENKVNELIVEQNHLMKDFELYKKAFKRYVEEHS